MLSNNRLKTESADRGKRQTVGNEKRSDRQIGRNYFFHVFHVTLNNSESKKRVISGA